MILLYKLAFVKASSYRTKIMKSLAEQNKTPKQLSIELKIHQNNISATLKELREKVLVEVVNPEAKKKRYYKLTYVGLKIGKDLK